MENTSVATTQSPIKVKTLRYSIVLNKKTIGKIGIACYNNNMDNKEKAKKDIMIYQWLYIVPFSVIGGVGIIATHNALSLRFVAIQNLFSFFDKSFDRLDILFVYFATKILFPLMPQ